MVFGKHLIIDANLCCEENIKNIEKIKAFIDDLCEVGKMEKKGDLVVEVFPENKFNIENDLVGYSICQISSSAFKFIQARSLEASINTY